MSTVRTTVVAVLSVLMLVGISQVVRAAAAGACSIQDPSCVSVGTGNPGSPGGSGGSGGSGGGSDSGPAKPDPCAKYPGEYHRLCVENKGDQCLALYNQYVGQLSFDDLNTLLGDNACYLLQIPIPLKSPGQLATEAADSFRLPDPSGSRSPSQDQNFHGHPFTYAGLWTWFWTDAGQWASCGSRCTATARDGANYATVTARPVSLTFDPGDGSDSVRCGGPGKPWRNAYANDKPASHSGCGYRYSKVTGAGYSHPVTSTQSITWELTWTGSGNTSGTLTNRTTSTTGRLNVLQIQTVVTR